MLYKYRHYIFDLGTLVDESAGIHDAFFYTFEQMGLPLTGNEEICDKIGHTSFEELIGRFGLFQEDAQKRFRFFGKDLRRRGFKK